MLRRLVEALRSAFVRRGKPGAPGLPRSVDPVSRTFGYDRGTPVDRRYIEDFLAKNAADIRGRVLEVGDDSYTRKFGGGRVSRADILHASGENPAATFVANLESAETVPSDLFDCVICTQTLQFIYDVPAAVGNLHRILKPGGVLLVTIPGISQISRYDMERWGEYWRFTTLSARRLFAGPFGDANVATASFGNVLCAAAFLQGLALEELEKEELDHNDPDYQLVVTVRAVK